MLRLKLLVFPFGILLLLSGCIVRSLLPLYTDENVIFDARLIGQWTEGRLERDMGILATGRATSISASFMRRTANRASLWLTFWKSKEKYFWIFSLQSQIGRKVFSTNFTSCPSIPLHMSSRLSQHYR